MSTNKNKKRKKELQNTHILRYKILSISKGGGMKGLMVAVTVLLSFCCVSIAAEDASKPAEKMMMGPGSMMQAQPMKMQDAGSKMMCNMKCGMCQKMMCAKQVVPVKNGFVVIVGKKMMKYDENLNLIKEAEIKADPEQMKTDMPDIPQMQK
jgi:hypothetical protein